MHSVCACNEKRSFLKRLLAPTPASVESARAPVLEAFGRIRRVSRRYSGERWDTLTTALSYTGKLRRRYLEAERSLREDGPVGSSDVLLRSFVKADKFQFAKFPKPRMIQPRSPRYNLALACWLKPFEHWLWGNLKSVGTKGVKQRRVVGKGLNPRQRAQLIVDKFNSFPDCVVFEVDGSAFEAHVDFWQLLGEHTVYETAFPGDGALKRLLNKQLHNFGVTANGVKFSRRGGRMSGDFNTGMGNSIVMLAVVDGVLRRTGVSRFDSLVDGDNAIIFLSGSEASVVVDNFARLALELSGHEMVLEKPTRVLERVTFGQSVPVELQSGWTMVRDWRKVLSTATSSHDNLNEPRYAREWLRAVALCESSLASGVPVLWAYANHLLDVTSGVGNRVVERLVDYQYLGVRLDGVGSGTRCAAPSEGARESFSRAYGITATEQLDLESSVRLGVPSFGLASPVEWSETPFYHDPSVGYNRMGV